LRIGTCRYCNNPRNLEGAEKWIFQHTLGMCNTARRATA
jgi:hypothetical protein